MDPRTPPLAGRHALVCGASAGIGRAAALALARAGAAVTVLARRRELLDALLPELREAGAPAARALPADLDQPEAAAAAVARFLEAAGSVQVLVNNAGGPPPGDLLAADPEDFLHAFRRHLFSAHLLVRQVLPGMRTAGWGRIVNVLSVSVREPIPRLGVGNTLRGAMAAWAKTLSRELPPGVTVNNVLPGFTATGRLRRLSRELAAARGSSPEAVEAGWLATVPEGRLLEPAEVGAAVAFLAGPGASGIRGQSLAVDGGRLACL